MKSPKTKQEVRSIVQRLIEEEFGVDSEEVTDDTSLEIDLSADSLDYVELVMRVEEEFGIECPDDEVEKLTLVRDINAYVCRKLGVR